MANSRGYCFWKLIMFYQTAGEGELTGIVGLGGAKTSKGNTKQYTFVWYTPRSTWVSMHVRQGGEQKRTTWSRNWSECGLWGGLGSPSVTWQRSISADMMYGVCPSWVCPAPQPWKAWLPGTASGKPAVCRLLWRHDFQKWSAWWSLLEVPLGTFIPGISKLSGKKPEEVSNWLFILSRQQAQGAVWSGECCSGRVQAQKATFIPWLKPVSTVPGDDITHRKNLIKSPMHHKICHPTGDGDSVSALAVSES